MQKDLEKRIKELEEFVKIYYKVYLESREIKLYEPISHNDQYFLYAYANILLGEPNGATLD